MMRNVSCIRRSRPSAASTCSSTTRATVFAGTVVDTDEEAWDDLMAVNVRGVYLCSKHAIPAMAKNGGGAIVNTASVVAAVGIRNRAAYCASKGVVSASPRAIAVDYVREGIRCNAVARGRSTRRRSTRS